jgi:Concanavalin A-like lectin/glucanases superfamily
MLDQHSGNTVADAKGQPDAVATNVTWVDQAGRSAAAFNGTDSDVATTTSILNTGSGASFTVSAWVYVTSSHTFATAVSQDSGTDSGFYLQYIGASDKSWAFSRVTANDKTADGIRAMAPGAALRKWTHLVGVYEGSTGQLLLYVNGVLDGTAVDHEPFAATGSLAIGRAEFGGDLVDWFPGDISDVRVYASALTPHQVAAIP